LMREAEALKAQGKTVVTGNAARLAISATGEVKGAYIALADVKAQLKGRATPVPTVEIQDPRTGKVVKAVKKADLQAGSQLDLLAANPEQQRRQDAEAQHQARVQAVTAEQKRREQLVPAIRAGVRAAQGSTAELRMIGCFVLDKLEYEAEMRVLKASGLDRNDWISERLKKLSADALRHLLMDCVIETLAELSSWEDPDRDKTEFDGLCTLYGVSPKATPTPSTAGAGAEKAGAGPAPAGGVKYRNPATGDTWSGRGLKPAWLRAQLAQGQPITDFEVGMRTSQTHDAGDAGGSDQALQDMADEVGA